MNAAGIFALIIQEADSAALDLFAMGQHCTPAGRNDLDEAEAHISAIKGMAQRAIDEIRDTAAPGL